VLATAGTARFFLLRCPRRDWHIATFRCARRWPARHRCPVGRLCHLEVVHASDVRPRRNGHACGRQCLRSAICATRSKGPAVPRSDTDHTGPSISPAYMLRHGCGYALANAGHDTRALQAWLGHKNIQHTVRYTELAPDRFKNFWR
jgi:Phage integrase family